MDFNINEKVGIVGGTAFSLIPNIPSDDLIVTIVMAFVGALVSFMVSKFLKTMFRYLKKFK